MGVFYITNIDGFYDGYLEFEGEEIPSNYKTKPPNGIFKPRWNDELDDWEEAEDPAVVMKKREEIEHEQQQALDESKRVAKLEAQLLETQFALNFLMFGG